MGWVGQLICSVLSSLGRGDQTLWGHEGAPAHSTATLRILASMPSRTIGERGRLPCARLHRSRGLWTQSVLLGSQFSCCWSLKLSISLGHYWILNTTACHRG